MKNIIIALEQIEEPGSFYAKRTTAIDKLHLEIKGFGLLKLPLVSGNAKALIKVAKPAKFGWRDKTFLDTKVRDAWEIPKSNIKIDNQLWNKELIPVLNLLKKDLGLPETATLKAKLHNLLIYEQNQFFNPHQDSEKSDGMVASLVVVLPSEHCGGSLIIDHHGDKKQFHTSRFPLNKLTFIAFYADCHHEVKALKSGYRIALTYNLILENHVKKTALSNNTKSCEALAQSLQAYFLDKKDELTGQRYQCKRWVYLLDHSYTQKGLSWNHLKNADHLRAEALKLVAETLDLEISMALADINETWDCEINQDHYRYRSYTEQYHEDEVQTSDLISSETTLQYWIGRENQPLNYKKCYIPDNQICWTKASNELEPFETEYQGWMGNYGNTLDRWYHRAAIILWQKKEHYAVLFEMDADSVISELHQLTKKKSQAVHQIITSLLPYWSEYLPQNLDSSSISTIFKLALYVKDPELARNMLNSFNMLILTPERTTLFLDLQAAYGTDWCVDIFNDWATTSNDRRGSVLRYEKISKIVKILSMHKNNKTLTDWILTYQLKNIKEYNVSCAKNNNRAELLKGTSNRIKESIEFTQACIIVNSRAIYIDFLKHIMQYHVLYPPLDLVIILDCLEEKLENNDLDKWDYKKLLNYILNELNKEKNLGPRKIDDWSINEELSCTCNDCSVLREFLQSHTLQTMVWPLAKERRMHIHQKIDGLYIPVTHQTEHTGSPHKLILKKTDKLHYESKQRFENVKKALAHLASLNVFASDFNS